MNTPQRPIVHRPLLDGTRGVMMWIVLGYHLGGITRLSGAWVSMDFFFVLSGYLITTLLVREYEKVGSIDLRSFYRRRVRRLAPALLATTAGLFLAAAVLGDDLFPNLRADGLATMFYVANWHFIWSSQAYFSSFDVSPLRHAWSLAIEEQFYIFWPLLFWALAKVTRFDRRKMMIILGFAAVASALWMRHVTAGSVDISRAYYGTDTRGQGLVIGSIMGLLLWQDRWDDHRGRRFGEWAGTAALGVLVLMMVFFTETSRPVYANGGFLVIALVSAVFIFGCARAERGPLVWIFGNRLSRHLGAISYCFYLWHWPVIVILDTERLGLSWTPLTLVRVAVSLALAEATYWLLERPVHTRRWKVERPVMVFGGAFVVVVAILLVTTTGTEGRPDGGGTSASGSDTGPEVLVLGDSLAWQLAGGAPDDLGYRVDGVWRAHCDIIGDRIWAGDRSEDADPECGDWPERWAEGLDEHRPDAVVVTLGIRQLFDPEVDGERLPVGSEPWRQAYGDAVRRAADLVRDRTDAPVLWLDVPCYRWEEIGDGLEEQDPERLAAVNGELREVLASYRDITIFEYRDRVCGGEDGDVVDFEMRPDGAHLSQPETVELWRSLADEIGRQLRG